MSRIRRKSRTSQQPPTGTARAEYILRRAVARALTHPLSLGGLAATAVFASAEATVVAAIATFAATGGWVVSQLRRDDFIQGVKEELLHDDWRQQVARVEAMRARLSGKAAECLDGILAAQERLVALAAAGDGFAPSRTEASRLLERCLHLLERRQQLVHYLECVRPADIHRQAEQLRHDAATAPDAIAADLYEQALGRKRAELADYHAVEQSVTRIDAQLAAVDATLDQLLGKIVRTRAGAAETTTAPNATFDPAITEELERLNHSVATLEATVAETLTVRG